MNATRRVGREPPVALHENVTVWPTPAGFGFTETFTETGRLAMNVAVALALPVTGLGWLSVTKHQAETFAATEDVVW